MKSLKIKIFLILSVLGLVFLTVIAVVQETERMIIMIAGAELEEKNGLLSSENINLPPEVLAHKPMVVKVAKEMNILDEVPYLLAIIMVESGGRGGDPFQSSESAGLPPNTITNPEQSIRQGVTHYKSCLDLANQYSIQDRKAVLQAYNYGGDFLSWLHQKQRPYSFELGAEFAKEQSGGTTVIYTNPIANSRGNWRYAYGNMFYAELVYQYVVSMEQGINEGNGGNIQVLEAIVGQSIYGGECYMLTAYYVEKLGGPQLRGSGFEYAERIGDDYNWSAYGWTVIIDPKPSDLRTGDIVNWYAGGVLTPQIFGHTGVISGVSNDGQTFTTYEQNAERGRVVAKYNRTFDITKIRSLVRKNG
ncbi:lysozyme family protein [Enterococcus faecalis]|uniref:lysozyme family protein n=1 Tax=Enterococcus faecalis TaxID=1351 RepID=UPI00191BF467|nr:lysozyme family protein [Enterococcus faecalis]